LRETIVVIDDEASVREVVRAYLERDGFHVCVAASGEAGLALALRRSPKLVILDLMLPDVDGTEICRELRRRSNVPILMLTAKASEDERVTGLALGADDYLTKPFNPRELVARIRSILRRASTPPPKTRGRKEHGSISIDADRREVIVDGAEVALAPKEFDLFWELLDHRGIVLTRDQLLERVWGYTFAGDTRTVDVHVRQLRRKIGEGCPVVTVWGVGYKVADSATPVT